MVFPRGILGSAINDGDLVSFRFPGSNLTMRLPKIPYNHDSENRVSEISDWTDQDTSLWDDFFGGKYRELVYQSWKYEDENTHDDVAFCTLQIQVQRLNGIDPDAPFTLCPVTFRERILHDLAEDEKDYGLETREGWPTLANNFLVVCIEKPVLPGLMCFFDMHIKQDSHPTPYALFVLGERFCLNITFSLFTLHYTDRKNPFSNDLLHQFKLDLFDEFLAHVQIEYSSEIIDKVQRMNPESY